MQYRAVAPHRWPLTSAVVSRSRGYPQPAGVQRCTRSVASKLAEADCAVPDADVRPAQLFRAALLLRGSRGRPRRAPEGVPCKAAGSAPSRAREESDTLRLAGRSSVHVGLSSFSRRHRSNGSVKVLRCLRGACGPTHGMVFHTLGQ